MSEEIKREESAQVERSEFAKPKGGFKRHCGRFWWIYLVVLIIIVVIVVPVILLVAVPKIAQKKINEAKLNLDGIVVTQTQTNNFTMAINSTITTDGSQHATIAAFDGVMYLEDWEPQRPFATVSFPQTTSAKFQEVNVTQFTPITDMEAFTVFNTWLLMNETLRVTVKGDTHVRVKGIARNYGVTFKKTITMPGLQNFNGTTVPVSTISLSTGDNFNGTVTVPNRSLVTFEIGNASFHNYLLGAEVGTVYIDDMILRPGLNNFSMHANISQLPVLTAIGESPYCETGILPFQLRGKAVYNHGQPLPYYADALASGNQTVSIDIGADLERDLKYNVTCKSS